MTDPFESLASPPLAESPRPEFVRRLRSQLVAALGITVEAPERNQPVTEAVAPTPPAPTPFVATVATPYLCARDAASALEFYATAFAAVETTRIVMDDGRVGHAEFLIGGARFYLADEFPELDVVSPQALGGTTVTLHLQIPDVDAAHARAIAAGAVSIAEPADQPHGSRHGGVRDPFGHRWILSTPLRAAAAALPAPSFRGVWSAINAADALAMIRFAVDVLGFEEYLVVPDETDPTVIVHSELRWPEGGVVQVGSVRHRPDSPFAELPAGNGSLYVITAEPRAVYERCVAAGVEIALEPEEPHYDPGGMGFTIRDAERNFWSFGTYAG